ncbi:D-alanine aminotransferase [Bacillus sp. FJAT-18017]|uniref:D-amino-acid transaminase n=1 Tax=Bacillus sp. FJAT-18017 TaxID=1705566 RepID=UPI0006B0149A|nr:D-amino-acid transaminase [Bacillus sp. FJAT-18017]ALC89628.1 D-alanine aminotransferase [Bacillus sp. FJAT-18017]
MEFVVLNGDIISRDKASIDVEDRGYQFGDGVYEVIRVYNGTMFTAMEHLERLEASAKKIGISLGWTIQELESRFKELIDKNQLTTGIVYLQVTRGISPRNHVFPPAGTAQTLVAYTRKADRPLQTITNGAAAIVEEDLRWLRCDIKSLNLLGNILAKQKAADAGCYEAILHRNGTVTEGSSSNIFIVESGTIYTHSANNLILNGITRQTLAKLCQREGIPFVEKEFTVEDLNNADEVILASTTSELTPIVKIDGKPVGNGEPGPVTRKVQTLFEQEIEKQCGSIAVKQ